jgi:hypothetical protein
MFLPSLDPTIANMARSTGCTYLEAARLVSLSRKLSKEAAFLLVQEFVRRSAGALFTYEPVNDVILLTTPLNEATISFVTDADLRDFYVQAVWKSPDGSDSWCTTKLPRSAAISLIRLLKPRWIADRLAHTGAELRELGFPDLAAKAERAGARVCARRR